MTEIASAAISAIVALLVAILAHRRAIRTQRAESLEQENSNTNEQVRVITEAYEGLLALLRGELERVNESRHIDSQRWESREKLLMQKIATLEHEVHSEKEERKRLQSRLDILEEDVRRTKNQ